MNELFGLSMNYIMIALLCILAVAFGSIAWVLLRNRVMFLVGVRNIPRRRAQTVLIVIGLMLSTLIISTAFSIGDTVNYSITSQAYDRLYSIDEIVQAQAESSEDNPFEGIGSLISALPIPEDTATELAETIRGIEGVDGATSVFRGPVAVSNPGKGQTEPIAILIGLPADQLAGFPDIETVEGQQVSPSAIAEGKIFANESAADALAIDRGDVLTLFVAGQAHEFTVTEIVRDRVLTGAVGGITEGFVLPLDDAQALFGREGEVDFIAVSNDGGVRQGVEGSEAVTKRINDALQRTDWTAATTKLDFVETAEETSSFIVTFFVVLGLFSIAAGMLLVFLIFVMLAAERKVEMGMVRAVGTKRRHLVQMFMSEGMVYNVGAAAVGCALGIAVSLVMVRIMARLFAGFDLSITFSVSLRSLIVSYSVGVVLTFLTVTFSSWRVGALNIVSAIRDTPEPVTAEERPSWRSSPLAFLRWFFFKPRSWGELGRAVAMVVAGLMLGAAGFGLFMAAASIYDTNAAASVAAVLMGVVGGLLIFSGAVLALVGLASVFQTGPLSTVAGLALVFYGVSITHAFPLGAGLTLFGIGMALIVRSLGAPPRPVFTAMGLALLISWLLLAGGNVPGTENYDGGIEMFFLSGVSMVIASTFVLVYNADLLLGGVTLIGRVVPSLVPSIRTAVAYPLANKFRTGMTIAMISLVMFALVMFSTMNENFDRIFLSDDALGGYDVGVTENPGNPIPDLRAALATGDTSDGAGGADDDTDGPPLDLDAIAGVDDVTVANRDVVGIDQAGGKTEFEDYQVFGASPEFIENNGLKFQARANGFSTDRAIWDALADNPDYAVIDAFAIGGNGFDEEGFVIEGIENTDRTFDPVALTVIDAATGRRRTVEVIGVLSVPASGLFSGLYLTEEAFDAVYTRPESTVHYVRLQPGAVADDVAKGIERTLLAQGAQADSLRDVVEEYQSQSRGFLYLIQGFMGIGLFVGIAAVGVIAFRTVVERRQQIGMLRAIGYTRRAIALSFVMESSFTALLGIGSGIVLGLLLANQLVRTDDFVAGGVTSFYIPWLQILAIAGFAFLASLVMTIIPSRQASSIPIAEALRYE